jgi:hypothetical protein
VRPGLTQVRTFLKTHLGLRYRKVAAIPVPPKKTIEEHAHEQARFLDQELEPALREARVGRGAVFFVDAAHFVWAPFLGCLWCLPRPLDHLGQASPLVAEHLLRARPQVGWVPHHHAGHVFSPGRNVNALNPSASSSIGSAADSSTAIDLSLAGAPKVARERAIIALLRFVPHLNAGLARPSATPTALTSERRQDPGRASVRQPAPPPPAAPHRAGVA